MRTNAAAAFVSTHSICQGQHVPILWPLIFATGHEIAFAHTSFKWANLASHNAGVTVVIVGISNHAGKSRRLFSIANDGCNLAKEVENINAYLINGANVIVEKEAKPLAGLSEMNFGSKPVDDGQLSLDADEAHKLINKLGIPRNFIRPFFGASEAIRGTIRYCIWVTDNEVDRANAYPELVSRFQKVVDFRQKSSKARTKEGAAWPHRFDEKRQTGDETVLVVPSVSSESRSYLPVGPLPPRSIVSNAAFALYDAPLWNMSLIASRLHLIWIAAVCGKLKTDFRYSNTLGWNTFPVPPLTEKNKTDLTRCAEDILLSREAHFPATIADLYDSDSMPEDLRHAHERNDEVLERIYIGRRFRNDTERLEKLFDLYTKMTVKQDIASKTKKVVS